MRFWDTSAIVPLLLDQPASTRVRDLLEEDPGIAAWWSTPVECASAAARLRREERLTVSQEDRVLEILGQLREAWLEIVPSEEIRNRASRLLRVHSLRAGDALQLAAARLWSDGSPGAELVTFDERLAIAARLEGFRVVPGQR